VRLTSRLRDLKHFLQPRTHTIHFTKLIWLRPELKMSRSKKKSRLSVTTKFTPTMMIRSPAQPSMRTELFQKSTREAFLIAKISSQLSLAARFVGGDNHSTISDIKTIELVFAKGPSPILDTCEGNEKGLLIDIVGKENDNYTTQT
jgi:hypothetical protein